MQTLNTFYLIFCQIVKTFENRSLFLPVHNICKTCKYSGLQHDSAFGKNSTVYFCKAQGQESHVLFCTVTADRPITFTQCSTFVNRSSVAILVLLGTSPCSKLLLLNSLMATLEGSESSGDNKIKQEEEVRDR